MYFSFYSAPFTVLAILGCYKDLEGSFVKLGMILGLENRSLQYINNEWHVVVHTEVMAVTQQPQGYARSEFQTGLLDCCSDCGPSKDMSSKISTQHFCSPMNQYNHNEFIAFMLSLSLSVSLALCPCQPTHFLGVGWLRLWEYLDWAINLPINLLR